MTVTAIIPTYNRSAYLEDCVVSILAQSEAADEVIILDDGSTDNTREIAQKYAGDVRYIYQENTGKSSALNNALSQSSGQAIWIVDDDDLAECNALAILKGALAGNPAAGFAFGKYDNFTDGPDGHRVFTDPGWRVPKDHDLFAALLLEVFVFQGAMLVRRDCYTRVGLFDPELPRSQDYDMLLRLLREFDPVRVDDVLLHQRQHAGVRGPAHLRIPGEEIWERQKAFDEIVMRKVYRDTPLSTYLPSNVADRNVDDPPIRLRALSRRIAGLVRRSLWDLAVADVREVSRLRGKPEASLEDRRLLAPAWREIPWETESGNLLNFAKLVVATNRSSSLRTVSYGVFDSVCRLILRNAVLGRGWVAIQGFLLYVRHAPFGLIPRHLRYIIGRGELGN